MQEIEIKFRVKSLGSIRAKLLKMGASLIWKGVEENYYFDTLNRGLKKKGQILRIKKWNGKEISLSLKTDLKGHETNGFLQRDEKKILVHSVKSTVEVLRDLGFLEILRYKKFREHWELEKIAVELDKIKNHFFVEIEGSKLKIRELAEKLDLDWKESTTESYVDLVERL